MGRPRIENPSPKTEAKRRQRAKKKREEEERKQAGLHAGPAVVPFEPSGLALADPAAAVVRWAQESLKVPTGPLRGQPFAIPQWQEDFLRSALAPGVGQAALSVARKNGKSGLVAVLLLAHLVGPLRRSQWRGVVVSLTAAHAVELRDAMASIIDVSGLRGAELRVSPHPGRILGPDGARVDILAADKATGHAIGADVAVIDEAGLMTEKDRPLWNALQSSLSGRNGRLICISIRGTSLLFSEMEILARRWPRDAVWVEHSAPPGSALDDPAAWLAANPGLATGIKSQDYMEQQARRAVAVPRNANFFRTLDLNQPGSPQHDTVVDVEQWISTATPLTGQEHSGPCFLGIDLGDTKSMSAAVVYWLDSGTIDSLCAWPEWPSLAMRGATDGVGDLYERWAQGEHLALIGERVTDNGAFLRLMFNDLAALGFKPEAIGCDSWRRRDVLQAWQEAGIRDVPIVDRGSVKGGTVMGSADIQAFQRRFAAGMVCHDANPVAEYAIRTAALSENVSGQLRIARATENAKIDWLSAAVIAVGLACEYEVKTGRRRPVN